MHFHPFLHTERFISRISMIFVKECDGARLKAAVRI